MRTLALVLVLVLVPLGCARRGASSSRTLVTAPPTDRALLRTVEGPGTWAGAGLTMPVPDGWSGVAGGGVRALTLTHRETGVELRLLREPVGPLAPVARRPGYHRVFEDPAAHRAVPLLTPAGAATWRADDDSGRVLLEWWGRVAVDVVRVELRVPSGRVLAALQIAEPLLLRLAAE